MFPASERLCEGWAWLVAVFCLSLGKEDRQVRVLLFVCAAQHMSCQQQLLASASFLFLSVRTAEWAPRLLSAASLFGAIRFV